VGPDDASRDATMLTLRFFLQNNEATSLANMAARYPELGVSSRLVSEFLRIRDELNAYLDGPSNLSISDDGPMTHRDILYVFLWGDLAHANGDHEATYRDLSQTPFFPLFQSDFVTTVRVFIHALTLLRGLNNEALAELRS